MSYFAFYNEFINYKNGGVLMNTKLDLKKEHKDLFKGKPFEVSEVFCKKSYYICIDGIGNPNTNPKYTEAIEALYQTCYTLKFMYKKKDLDFVVMPLSSLWWTDDNELCNQNNKDNWKWRAMIEIPSFITEEDICLAKNIAFKKNNNESILEILNREMNEGTAYQILHIGPYNEEELAVNKLYKVINENGYKLRGKHHEIYLNDPRKTPKDKLKTIIRQPVFKEACEILDFLSSVNDFFNNIGPSKTMVLSTTNNETVSSRNMSIIINNNKFYFQTALEFRKCEDIKKNKNVALCLNNIQIEGKVTNIFSLYDDEAKDFKNLYKEHNKSSYDAYSKLMGNRIFEVTPTKISTYNYDGDDVYLEFIDFINKTSYKRPYILF
ncbi:pyridoxamine 5'-phosphate oxidase family protein [Clostridium baratii str. Sullivan]|uniref:Pyridoxamine 5'-phosphate oxidase family protein n=2 Tax=Clostridium baratii TaxID=1561 RepID=A0A0A7FVE1_9CLOT|nr:pyridoxamine 5'-phosphate oxidase family protein [Clostridium baratii str. Sullivan]